MASSSSLKLISLTICSNSYYWSMDSLSTILLKVNFKFTPSHASLYVQPCSLTIKYIFQNYIAREHVTNHKSSQNLIFLPLPNCHLKPNLAALAAHNTSFKEGDAFLGVQQNKLEEQLLYLWSIIALYNLPSASWYLCTQEARRHRLRSLKSGTRMPPSSFFWARDCQLDRWYFLLFSWSFQKKLVIWELMASTTHLGNLITSIMYIGMLAKHALSNVILAP
jgi:hypothetical protein